MECTLLSIAPAQALQVCCLNMFQCQSRGMLVLQRFQKVGAQLPPNSGTDSDWNTPNSPNMYHTSTRLRPAKAPEEARVSHQSGRRATPSVRFVPKRLERRERRRIRCDTPATLHREGCTKPLRRPSWWVTVIFRGAAPGGGL